MPQALDFYHDGELVAKWAERPVPPKPDNYPAELPWPPAHLLGQWALTVVGPGADGEGWTVIQALDDPGAAVGMALWRPSQPGPVPVAVDGYPYLSAFHAAAAHGGKAHGADLILPADKMVTGAWVRVWEWSTSGWSAVAPG